MFTKLCLIVIVLAAITTSGMGLILSEVNYPAWTFTMKIWPFDILYPFETGFAILNGESMTTDSEIRERMELARSEGANVVLFYIDDEQSYETFVDEIGFGQTLQRIQYLVNEAHIRDLKTVCYLNGLEVITVGARLNLSMPSLARNFPEWLQIDIAGLPMVWYTTQQTGWIPEDSEDAWASPLSPWSDLFRSRLGALGSTGLDGVYIDATFLPGVDDFGIKWASKDPYFQNAFHDKYGFDVPASVDWNALEWRQFVFFRHEVIRDYLGEMAETARANGMVPFFESSSCDGMSGTYLGNDVSFTISGGIACSPEIEPEGDFRGAFRMSKATRDANQTFPMWFLGWPQNSENARREFAVNLCHSGNYYPTVDAQDFYPENAFAFLDLLREPVLDKRQPVQNTVLIYPMRSKDYTFQSETTFMSYVSAFTTLAEKHIPFRILPLETMRMDDLVGIDHVVLAGAVSISDNEFDLIKDKIVYPIGTNGTLDEWGITRNEQIGFPNVVDISSLTPNLPFSILAPPETYIEYFIDNSDSNHYIIFTYNDIITGEIVIGCSSPMTGKVYELDKISRSISGSTLSIQIGDYLQVIEIRLGGMTSIEHLNQFDSIESDRNPCLHNSPNPFNSSTSIHFFLQNSAFVSLKIFNFHGQYIKTLVNEHLSSGRHEIPFSDNNLFSGIYLMRLEAGSGSFWRRMIVLR